MAGPRFRSKVVTDGLIRMTARIFFRALGEDDSDIAQPRD
jgi:hypothetical protein